MGRQDPPFVVHQRDFRPLHLARPETSPQLAHRLDDPEKTARRTSMGVGEHTAVRVDRQLATDARMPLGEEGTALAALAQAKLLHFDDGNDREAVVQFSKVDITGAEARHLVRNVSRFRGAEFG